MKDQEFLATLKLVSGEEVISMVLYLEDEDKVLLSNPFSVEQSRQKQGQLEITGFSFKEWVMASFDDMYIIGRDHIITITEVEGPIKEFYEKNLEKIQSHKQLLHKPNKLPRKSGYLGSINDTKNTLENIYKKS
jgi:hypothetical protein|tara:strand:+ start:230 stop:631 length:402 start_codon:yes stop_codon:yes gene_type:complete